jgi:hypothetical protein
MTHTFKLEWLDGTPADPPTFETTVLVWNPRRHDPAGEEQDAPSRPRPPRRCGRAPGAGRSGPGLKSL